MQDLKESVPSAQDSVRTRPAISRAKRGKARRQAFQAQGLCTECGKASPIRAILQCDTCDARNKAYRRRPAVKERTTRINKARYAEALSKGLCGTCQRRPHRVGWASCEPCGKRPRNGKATMRRARHPSPPSDDDGDFGDRDEPTSDTDGDSDGGYESFVETLEIDDEEIKDEIIVKGYQTAYKTVYVTEDETDDETDNEHSSQKNGEVQDQDEPMPDEHGSNGESPVDPVRGAHESDKEQHNPTADHARDNRMDIDFLLS